jgi:hypothetical protein
LILGSQTSAFEFWLGGSMRSITQALTISASAAVASDIQIDVFISLVKGQKSAQNGQSFIKVKV